MQQVTRNEIENIYEFANHREILRDKVIARKKARTLSLGPLLNITFEDHELVKFYIQEAAWAERVLDEDELLGLIKQYNQLLPTSDNLVASVIINIEGKENIQSVLHRFSGFEKNRPLALEFPDDLKLPANIEPGTMALQPIFFAHFSFEPEHKNILKDAADLVVKYRNYAARVSIPDTLRNELYNDLG